MKKQSILPFIMALSVLLIMYACDAPQQETKPSIRSLTATEQAVVDASNNFSTNMLRRVNENSLTENIFISSFSMSTALSMTLNGAKGETKEAIKKTLGLESLSDMEINTCNQELIPYLMGLDPTVNLNVANSTWYREDLTVKRSFEDLLVSYYQALVKSADFTDPASIDLINGWIEDETAGKIKDMLQQIPPSTVMYLINAIYFKANWHTPFDEDQTTDKIFHLIDGSSVEVPMMYAQKTEHWLNYDAENEITLVDIPYGNEAYGFTIVMPEDASQINQLAASFSMEDLDALLTDTVHVDYELELPKLKIAFKETLNDYLIDMGMGIAFSPAADLSNLFEENTSLMISTVLHQSFLEVNEKGSEAAAATIVEIIETSLPPKTTIDKPFLFFIRERNSNTILFSGKVMNPSLE